MEDNVTTNVAPTTNTDTPVVTEAHVATPDYTLPEKFKSVNELVTSYGELEKKLGGYYGSPDEYKWELEGKEPDGVKLFKEVAKENNLSQTAFNKIVSGYLAKEKAIAENLSAQLEETKKELGAERIEKAKNLTQKLGLSQEQLSVLDKFVVGKEQFEILEHILAKVNNSTNTVISNGVIEVDPDVELKEIYGKPDYKYNAAKYHSRVMELTKKKLGI